MKLLPIYYPRARPVIIQGEHSIFIVIANQTGHFKTRSSCVLLRCLSPPQTHQERAPENEWLDIAPHPVYSQDCDSFLLLAGIQETGTEHFTHIKHVTITQQRMSVISHGRYEVRARRRIFAIYNLSHFTLSISLAREQYTIYTIFANHQEDDTHYSILFGGLGDSPLRISIEIDVSFRLVPPKKKLCRISFTSKLKR